MVLTLTKPKRTRCTDSRQRFIDICRLIDEGYTPEAVGKQLGYSGASSVCSFLKVNGAGYRAVRDRLKAGATPEQLADEYLSSPPPVASVQQERRTDLQEVLFWLSLHADDAKAMAAVHGFIRQLD